MEGREGGEIGLLDHPELSCWKHSQGTHSLLLDVLCPDGAFSSSFVFLLSLALFSSSFWIKQTRNTSRQMSTLPSQWSCKCFIFSRYCAVYRERSVQTTKTFPKASSLHQIFDQILNPEIGNKEKQNLTSELSTRIKKSGSQIVHFRTKVLPWNTRKKKPKASIRDQETDFMLGA